MPEANRQQLQRQRQMDRRFGPARRDAYNNLIEGEFNGSGRPMGGLRTGGLKSGGPLSRDNSTPQSEWDAMFRRPTPAAQPSAQSAIAAVPAADSFRAAGASGAGAKNDVNTAPASISPASQDVADGITNTFNGKIVPGANLGNGNTTTSQVIARDRMSAFNHKGERTVNGGMEYDPSKDQISKTMGANGVVQTGQTGGGRMVDQKYGGGVGTVSYAPPTAAHSVSDGMGESLEQMTARQQGTPALAGNPIAQATPLQPQAPKPMLAAGDPRADAAIRRAFPLPGEPGGPMNKGAVVGGELPPGVTAEQRNDEMIQSMLKGQSGAPAQPASIKPPAPPESLASAATNGAISRAEASTAQPPRPNYAPEVKPVLINEEPIHRSSESAYGGPKFTGAAPVTGGAFGGGGNAKEFFWQLGQKLDPGVPAISKADAVASAATNGAINRAEAAKTAALQPPAPATNPRIQQAFSMPTPESSLKPISLGGAIAGDGAFGAPGSRMEAFTPPDPRKKATLLTNRGTSAPFKQAQGVY